MALLTVILWSIAIILGSYLLTVIFSNVFKKKPKNNTIIFKQDHFKRFGTYMFYFKSSNLGVVSVYYAKDILPFNDEMLSSEERLFNNFQVNQSKGNIYVNIKLVPISYKELSVSHKDVYNYANALSKGNITKIVSDLNKAKEVEDCFAFLQKNGIGGKILNNFKGDI